MTLILYLWAVLIWVVELALFGWDVFEMAAPIQSPAKCEVRSIIQFLNAKSERPAKIHKQTVALYGNVWYESAKCDEVVPWILWRKDWCSRRTKER